MQETSLVLRTNPLLTGNVKISISGDNLYLNSIESNDRLSSSTFKDVKINPNSHYAKDIYNFFEKGQTPTSLIFDAKNINNDKVVTDDFSKQYEHRYNYGVERCLEKSYDEQYKILAPLWLTRDIPKHFIIFKVPGAKHIEYERNPEEMVIGVNYKIIGDAVVINNNIEYRNNVVAVTSKYKIIGDGYVVMDDDVYEMSQVDIRKDFISKSQVVKVFNMRSGNIGTYLNNHINDPLFNENSIYTNFDEKTITYNGISINNGLFVNKITNISEQIKNEPTIINFDEYVTRGYERNRLLSANLLNFEFLFDDDENYKFNRYFGLYCNDTDLSTFYLNKHTMFNLLYPNQYMNKSNIPHNYSSEITDEDGVKIIMDEISSVGYTPDYDKIKNNNSFYYIKDKYDNILKINNDACDNNLVLSRKSINSDIISGFNTSVELDGEISQIYGKSLLEMTINNELYNGYTISIYYKNNRVGYVYADTLKNLDYEYNEGDSTFRFFHPLGTNEEIAGALAGALRWSLKEAAYATIVVSHTDNRIIIRNTTTGSDNIPLRFVIHNDKNEITLSSNNMLGNSNTKFSRAKIDSEFVSILTDKSYILTDQGYSKIKEVVLCIDDIKYTSDGKTITNPDELGRKSSIIISDPNQKISLKNGKISVYNESPIKLGILDIYNVGDLDFDFDSSSYSKSYNHEYDKYFDTDDDKLIIGETYFLFSKDDKTASISHNGTIKESNQTGIQRFVAITDNFESLTDNAVVINQKYYDDDELKIFIGFKTLQDASGGVVVDNMEDKISKLSTNINATEYDRLKENVISTNATKSKITPHINKWVLDGGKDIRDNDYRLNASLSFGKYNFSPSFIDDFQNPLYFTHEWLYLSNTPEAIDLLDLKYQTAYFSKKFEISKLKNVNEDYFTKYFTINSVFKNKGDKFEMIDVEPQKRFTDVKKITKNKFETFFRGVRINISSDTIDYTGYKFSSIMNLNKTKIFSRENPYKISIIENRDHKNITLVIDVTIDDYKILPNLDERIYGEYLFLYTMNSLKRWNHDDKVYELGLEMNLPDLDAINSVKIQKRLDGGGLETITKIRGTKIHNQARYKYTSGINHLEFNADKFPLGYFLKVVKDGSYGKVYGWNEDDAFMLTSDHSFTGQEFIIEKPATINDILGNIIDIKPPVSNGVGGISIGYIPFYSTVGNFAPLQINGFFSLALLYWFQEGGGSNYYDDLAKSLSFSTINNNIKENYNIDYKLCSDGELLDNNDMSLGMVEPTEISKLNDYDVEEENIISPELPEENIKDYVYKDKQIKEQIFRYSGYYSPKINSVLKFLDDNVDMVWGLYEKTWASVDKLWKNPLGGNFTSDKTPEELNEDRIPYSTILHDKNVKLDISNKNFGFIRNFYMHKIGSPNIISLSNPVYVNANEIAIDKTDIDIFSSQWDAQYHKLFTSKSTSNSVYGTKNMVDGKSFLGTKMLTLENNILVDNYDNISKGVNISNVAYEMGNTDLVYESTPDRLSIRISYNNILRNYLKENIKDEFIKYVNYFNTNYKNDNDAINAYINDNLIASYMMDSIIFYVKTHNDENIEIINNEKNELLLLGNGYILNKNFKSYEIVDGELLLTMATAKETKYSVNVKFSLKII